MVHQSGFLYFGLSLSSIYFNDFKDDVQIYLDNFTKAVPINSFLNLQQSFIQDEINSLYRNIPELQPNQVMITAKSEIYAIGNLMEIILN